MNFTEYTTIKNKFSSSPNLCELFKLLSIETWKRIEYAYMKPGVKVFETTLTQNIIFTINAYNDQYGLNIEIYESLNERVNGNDMELIIKYPKDGVEYYAPIQAKKIYKNGKYSSLEHGNQIELFIGYALKKKAKPLYLLYNYDQFPIRRSPIPPYKNIELIGCSIVSADYLYNNYYNKRISKKRNGSSVTMWQIPEFSDLFPTNSFAWHELICPENPSDLFENLKAKKIIINQDFRNVQDVILKNNEFQNGFFKINTISKSDSNSWIDLKEYSLRDEYVPDSRNEKDDTIKKSQIKDLTIYSERENNIPEFSPKSRIVITKNEQ